MGVAAHLALAGFALSAIEPLRRPGRPGENRVVARAIVRRHGHQIITVVRMDRVGEVYTRLADGNYTNGAPSLREIGDDDD